MKAWYKMAGMLMLSTWATMQANAQTHYGAGAGMQGISHAFFGTEAGKINLGSANSFIGHQTGFSNTNGSSNTFVGSAAGYQNVTGHSNTFLGSAAGSGNISGNQNVYIGDEAGLLGTNAGANVAIGYESQRQTSNGIGNCSIGYRSHWSGGGSFNVVMGTEAGYYNTTGWKNTFLGYQAGYFNDTGELNTFVGNASGRTNTTGHHNAFFGENAGFSNKEGFFNTFLGSESGYLSQTGVGNVFLGNKSGYSNTNGHNNVFLGYGAGYQNTTGQRNTYLGYGASGNPSLENAAAIGSEAKVTASNSIVLGNKANVGIGVSAPAFQLHLSTDAAAKAGSPNWTVASDSRLKKNVSDFTDGLDLLKQIKPIWFQYNGKAGIETGDKKFVGVVAQEMQKVAPYTIGNFIYQDSLGNKTEYLDYDANAVTYILINSVKEQQKIIEEKNIQIHDLTERLEKIETLLSSGMNDFHKNERQAALEQNAPNGFTNQTAIKYFIPQSVKTAVIDIYTVAGVKVSSHLISRRGAGELVISADEYKSGMHVYDLVTDGKSIGAKKMLVE